MNKFKYLFVAIFATLLLCGCASHNLNADTNNNTSVVYATSVTITETNLTKVVGDTLSLSNLNVTVAPANATVKPTYTINNTQVATLENSTLTFNQVGTVTLTATISTGASSTKTHSVAFNVDSAPNYATTLSVEKTDVILNFDETVVNKFVVAPSTYNQLASVTYSIENVVSYNLQSGLITPINSGSTKVTVKLLKSKTELIETSFNVTVTNFVYAQNLLQVTLNNKDVPAEITLNTNEQGNFSCLVEPSNYNMGVTYFSSNNLILVNPDGTIKVGNTEGSCTVTISVQTKTGVVSKQVLVNIVSFASSLNFEVSLNNANVDCLYTGITYDVTVLTELSNYSLVTFSNCNYSYVSGNKFKVTIPNAGNVTVVANYTLSSFINSYNISGSKTFNVYNPITDINFALTNVSELVPNNGQYTLYLPNKTHLDSAISDNALVFANVSYSAKGVNTKPDALSLTLTGNSVTLSNNQIVASQLGESKLIIASSDIAGFTKEFVINVVPLTASKIEVNSTDVNLYINGTNLQPNCFELVYNVIPSYAYSTAVEISLNSNIISINNNVVTAVSEGSAQVTLSCGDVTKIVNVNVNYVPTSICAYLNSVEVANNQEVTIETNKNYYLTAIVYSGSTETTKNVSCYINNALETNCLSSLKLNFSAEGSHLIKLECDGVITEFVLKAITLNPVIELSFSSDELNVNMFETTSLNLNYSTAFSNPSIPTTDTITFESSNNSVAVVNGETLTFVGTGSAVISAKVNAEVVDELTVNVINKEIHYISSVSDFISINPSKNYVVTNNLDFSNFTYSNATTFAGEIDFNNKTISNLNTRLFNKLEEGAVIKNLVIIGGSTIDASTVASCADIDPCFSLISEVNYGTICNISFSNFSLNILNETQLSCVNSTLVAVYNYGLISGITLTNSSINFNFSSSKVTGAIAGGLSYVNLGEISNISGLLTFNGFTRVGGVVLENYSKLTNINLNLVFNCSQDKNQIGGIAYRNALSSTSTEIANVQTNITINNTNGTEVSFAGFVYNPVNNADTSNINLNLTFNGTFSTSSTYLIYYYQPSNVADVESFNIISNQNYSNYPS